MLTRSCGSQPGGGRNRNSEDYGIRFTHFNNLMRVDSSGAYCVLRALCGTVVTLSGDRYGSTISWQCVHPTWRWECIDTQARLAFVKETAITFERTKLPVTRQQQKTAYKDKVEIRH